VIQAEAGSASSPPGSPIVKLDERRGSLDFSVPAWRWNTDDDARTLTM